MPRNRGDRSAISRKYYLSHKEECLARGRRYMATHREQMLAYQKKWREENKRQRKHQQLMRDFGISIEEYEIQFAKQGGVCASCGDPPPKGKYLSIDHKHSTGELRALLCNGCNLGIGFFKEDPVRLEKAIKYLNKHASSEVTSFGTMGPPGKRNRLP
jgi:Recombination endonuclease VII